MKRVFYFILLLFILFVVYQFVVMLFIDHHQVSYTIAQDEKSFSITETFSKENKQDHYFFEIQEGDHLFYFHSNTSMGKRDHVIQALEVFLQNDLYCLYPVLEKDTPSSIVCLKDGKLVSYASLRQQNNVDIGSFVEILQNKGYQNPGWQVSYTSKEYRGKLVYQDNLIDGEIVTLWNYQGLDLYQKEDLSSISLLSSDRYENDFGALVSHYYIIPNYDQKHDFNTMYLVNLLDHSKKSLYFDDDISFDSYVQGVVDSKYYLFDREHKKQYEINPKQASSRLIGSIDLEGQYFDGESWSSVPISRFVSEKLTFPTPVSSSVKEKYPDATIYEFFDRSYVITPQKEVYLVYRDHLDHPIFLFQDSMMQSVTLKDGAIYYIKDNILYRYSDIHGLKPLVSYNEFRYNHQYIYDVYLSY